MNDFCVLFLEIISKNNSKLGDHAVNSKVVEDHGRYDVNFCQIYFFQNGEIKVFYFPSWVVFLQPGDYGVILIFYGDEE